MNNFPAFGLLLAFAAAALLLAALVIVGCLIAAAMYPRGHPSADRLRAFAGRLPRLVARGVMLLDGFAFVLVLAMFAVLTVVFS
ncbi:hypothetical protein FB547_12269 [Variovorax beijingensis]|uniref:Transmembrane protein n=2 Tax=Variovorax TaxID=34072 RepID=A0AAE3Y3C3_VARPD|nr:MULTISPECIES: hypothetical protein [Variovorax]MBD9668823.1 hypothetical protein [Variovorax sp. VRV01]MDP9968074.1 hypothetical protein [Variovorax paradoxus]MDR6429849.1 hypothetical protein [Variovorax paradoxus]MDR6456230.1 hypothetical protein [Variovorax paradoxus]TWD73577.1 hypothetical protein FB547_12269 [Variovorax beijingensis]